ncbi:hypothetical protein BGX27_009895 [Mortierella sp. AM989]|nr:hypothetical protein BGX27_009895 [Mortierella sp. AM989]
MSFWDSLDSASTCVDSPSRTLPKNAASVALDRVSDLYAKCQELTSLHKSDKIQRKNETGEVVNNKEEIDVNKHAYIVTGDKNDREPVVAGEDRESAMEMDIEVLPWLQEVVQMISVLEAKLVELEKDCQSIPLYEEDRTQMVKVIQELDTIVQLDQAWIDNTENAMRRTSFALEEALLSSGTTQKYSIEPLANSGVTAGLEWKSRSVGMLPSLALSTPKTNNAAEQATHQSSGSNGQREGLEATYRNAITTALRHLKTIERSQITKSESTNLDDNIKSNLGVFSGKVAKGPPNLALEKWLENASMTSLHSDKNSNQSSDAESLAMGVDEDTARSSFGDRNDDPCGNTPLSQPRNGRSEDRQGPASNLTVPSLANHELYPHGLMMDSTQLQDSSQLAPTKAMPDLSTSAASFQATVSGSSQSLQTNLGGCLLDERIFLKQHIQALDRLRVQEQERHQKAEQIHHQLVLDLERFSKELLQSVNELTCAQAALDESRELALIAFRSAEGIIADVSNSAGGSSSESGTADTAKRTKRMIGTSAKALTESLGMVEHGIKRMRVLAADCVGITELAQIQSQNQSAMNNVFEETVQKPVDALSNPPVSVSATPMVLTSLPPMTNLSSTGTSASIASRGSLTVLAPPLPLSTAAVEQESPSLFVDGIAFQEFEGHLASLRSTLGSISKKFLNSSINNRVKNSIASNGTLITTSANLKISLPLPQLLSSALSSTIEMTPFMKRVLAEDIYPCLLTHPRSVIVKQTGWMSSLLYSSSCSASSTAPAPSAEVTNNSSPSYSFNQQTPWFQRLLKAMERNACEIEFWKTSHQRTTTKQRQNSTTVTTATTPMSTVSSTTAAVVATAPKVSCCLCGIARPCEFKLRFMDHDSGTTTNTKANAEQQLQHPLDRFCRDRIVAVCDFYMFLAHLRQGLLDYQSDLELFRKALWLRQRMGCARIGSIDIGQTPPTMPLLEAARE